ncbi:unnamed protein product, partial [Brassica oleracea var. botrytis]
QDSVHQTASFSPHEVLVDDLSLFHTTTLQLLLCKNIAAGKQEEGTFCFSLLGKLAYSKVELQDDGSVSEVDKDISLLSFEDSFLKLARTKIPLL